MSHGLLSLKFPDLEEKEGFLNIEKRTLGKPFILLMGVFLVLLTLALLMVKGVMSPSFSGILAGLFIWAVFITFSLRECKSLNLSNWFILKDDKFFCGGLLALSLTSCMRFIEEFVSFPRNNCFLP